MRLFSTNVVSLAFFFCSVGYLMFLRNQVAEITNKN